MPSLAHAAAPALTAGASRGNIARSSPLRAPRSRSAAPLASRAVRGATFDSDASCPPSVVARSFVAPRGVSRAAFSRPRPRRRSLASANDLDDAPAVAAGADALDDAPASSAESLDADAIVAEVLAAVADTDSGRDVTDEQREATDACIARLERIGATQVPRALENPKIFGDYDVDGATSSAILAKYLRWLGLDPVIHIPDRIIEGYGPNGPAIEALKEGGAGLLVTVDCGSTSFEAFEVSKKLGLEVVVIDHHQVGARTA